MSTPIANKRFSWEPVAITVAAVIGAVGVIVAALVGGDVINISAGPVAATPTPQIVTVTATPAISAPPSTDPKQTATPNPADAATVRRTTVGKVPLTLKDGYSADLDSMNPSWDTAYAVHEHRFDIALSEVGLGGKANSDFAVVSDSSNYDTCLAATGYVKRLRSDEVRTGTSLCFRTSEKRHAFILVKKAAGRGGDIRVDLEVTVWDPQYEE